jgi:predicted permease
MDRLKGWMKQLRAALRPGRVEREMDEELRFHVDQETTRNVALGMAPAEARRAALVSFGAAERFKDELRGAGLRGLLGEAARDLRHAVRTMRRRPTLSAAVIGTLGLGIGVSTAMYSVVYAAVLQPLPYPHGDRLVAVWETYPGWRGRPVLGDFWDRIGLAWPDYEQWRGRQQSFDEVAVFARAQMTASGGEAERLEVGRGSASLWTLLGVTPALGRTFAEVDDGAGAPPVAVVSHALWQGRFGGDAGVIGGTIALDDQPFSIVGVLAPDFRFSGERGAPPDVWIPVGAAGLPLGPDNHHFSGIGRLRAGTRLESAAEESATIFRGDRPANALGAALRPYQEDVVGSARPPLVLLLAGTGVLLLIACVNVAALIASDTARREREVATRLALGASRARLLRQFLAEGLALALAAALAGVATASQGIPLLTALAPPDLPRMREVGVNGGVLAFALAAALVVTLVCTMSAVIVSGSRRPATEGKAPRRVTARGRRAQPVFVAVQMVLLTVLLTAAALLSRSLLGVRAIDPGFSTAHLLTTVVDLPAPRYEARGQLVDYYQRLVERVGAIPGVEAVTGVSTGPFADGSESTSVGYEGLPEEAAKPELQRRVVLPGYFDVTGIRVIEGAVSFDGGGRTVAVSQRMAERLWPGQRAVGRRISLRDQWYDVAAVVGDVRDQALTAAPEGTYYVSLQASRETSPRMRLILRSPLDEAQVASGVRDAMRSLDASIPVEPVERLDALAARSLAAERYRTLLVDVFAGASLVLAAAGIFGVTLRLVLRRRREFGVRLALGARPAGLLASTIGRTAGGAAAGVSVGLLAAWALMPALSPYLHEMPARDPTTFVASAAALVVVSLAAAAIPARRAARVDVAEILRDE